MYAASNSATELYSHPSINILFISINHQVTHYSRRQEYDKTLNVLFICTAILLVQSEKFPFLFSSEHPTFLLVYVYLFLKVISRRKILHTCLQESIDAHTHV